MSLDDLLWVGILGFAALVYAGVATERISERRAQRRRDEEYFAELRRRELGE